MTQEVKSGDLKNIDSVLVQDMHERATGSKPEPAPQEHLPSAINQEVSEQFNVNQPDDSSQFENSPENDPYLPPEEQVEVKNNEPTTTDDTSPIDEYGNPVDKPRLYTEEEVNQRIRERLSRGKYAEEQRQQPRQQQQQQYTQQQVNQAAADGFEHDPNSGDSWEQQLESFINQTIEKRVAREEESRWKQQEYDKQMAFQDKFTSGMEKYKDFREVVAGKPITDSMMLATRNMDNPAAFVYAASKLHPQELDRISKIADPYAQASEVGRLHERMVKERKNVTNAPKPLQSPRGDVPSRVVPNQISIEQRIAEHAKQKRK